MGDLLDRAVQAEQGRAHWETRARDLQDVLESLIDQDPGAMGRAVSAEGLLEELMGWIGENPSVRELLPTGFAVRLEAQLRVISSRASALAPVPGISEDCRAVRRMGSTNVEYVSVAERPPTLGNGESFTFSETLTLS